MHPPDPPIHTVQLICMHSSTQTSRIEIAPLPILLTHKFTVIYTIIPRLPKLYSVMLYGSFWTQLTASKHPQYEEIGGSIDFLCLLYLPSWQRNGGGSQPETSLNYIIPSHPLTTVFPHIIHSLCSSLTRSVCLRHRHTCIPRHGHTYTHRHVYNVRLPVLLIRKPSLWARRQLLWLYTDHNS